MKIRHYTDKDLDGIACQILSEISFGEHVDMRPFDRTKLDEEILRVIGKEERYNNYDKVFITDMSISESVAEDVENSWLKNKIQILDHHESALSLNKYSWAKVSVKEQFEGELKKACGASLYYTYLDERGYKVRKYKNFIEQVRLFDTFEWFPDIELPKQINDILFQVGPDKFVNRFINNPSGELTDTERFLLEVVEENKKAYFKRKQKQLDKIEYEDHVVGFVIAEQYISELGNHLMMMNEDIDYVLIVSSSTKISLRSTDQKENVFEIAEMYGGGGHRNASGFSIDRSKVENILKTVLEKP